MKIDHVAVWTGDLERLKNFYCKYFGAEPGEKYINPAKKFESYFLSFESGARLELMQMPGIPANQMDILKQYTGIIHIAISVGSCEEVIRLTDLLCSDGYPVLSRPRKTGDGYFESCVTDPDGNRLEITA